MLLSRRAQSALRTATRRTTWRRPYGTGFKKSDPLRILFCGSDEFSCASLQALHDEHKINSTLIRSIDVVVRPSKPTGRGYRVMREVPLRSLAQQLDLPIHERDTFTGWNMPQPDGEPINLIIAVSFGLFVPPRLIHASKYGGLNVHPSLLPDLRGPAPIHHALLAERAHTGITIQTLSPEAFDAGVPLLQTPAPGVPIPDGCTPARLHDLLAPLGARLLVRALRAGLHVPPHAPFAPSERQETPPPAHAPKITPRDRQVLWTSQAAREVALRHRVLGPLWTHVRIGDGKGKGKAGEDEDERGGKGSAGEKRAILEDLSAVPGPPGRTAARAGAGAEADADVDVDAVPDGGDGTVVWVEKAPRPRTAEEGQAKDGGTVMGTESKRVALPYWVDADGEGGVVVRMADGSWLRIGRIKIEGSTSKPAGRHGMLPVALHIAWERQIEGTSRARSPSRRRPPPSRWIPASHVRG
ncbi:hypothetical protein VTH06DRAFT_5162 [Thermothelomyces fergusii]